MESSSPTAPPVYHSAASSAHSQTVEDKVEVQALNKKLRGEAPEETRKMLPDYQATSDSNQSRAFASLKTSLSSNTRASVSQKRAELTGAEKIFSGQFPGTDLPHSLKLIPERSEQETSKSEQPTEIPDPDVVAFRNKQSFFEDQIKQKIENNTALHKEHRASHTSIHNYQPGKVSAESKWDDEPA